MRMAPPAQRRSETKPITVSNPNQQLSAGARRDAAAERPVRARREKRQITAERKGWGGTAPRRLAASQGATARWEASTRSCVPGVSANCAHNTPNGTPSHVANFVYREATTSP